MRVRPASKRPMDAPLWSKSSTVIAGMSSRSPSLPMSSCSARFPSFLTTRLSNTCRLRVPLCLQVLDKRVVRNEGKRALQHLQAARAALPDFGDDLDGKADRRLEADRDLIHLPIGRDCRC